jgi:hypothetical protein
MSLGQLPTGKMSLGQTLVVQMPLGQILFGQLPLGQMSLGQILFGQLPLGQMSFGQIWREQNGRGDTSCSDKLRVCIRCRQLNLKVGKSPAAKKLSDRRASRVARFFFVKLYQNRKNAPNEHRI